jgi:dolichol-phosphate mannosyltransferase
VVSTIPGRPVLTDDITGDSDRPRATERKSDLSLVGEVVVDEESRAAEAVELAIVIPALSETANLRILLPELARTLDGLNVSYKILVVDRNPSEATRAVVRESRAVLLSQAGSGYGMALRTGFAHAHSEYVLTMDADLSHSPKFIEEVFRRRGEADLIIASRYVEGGDYKMPFVRALLSKALNKVFARGLALDLKDMSSGFRLYRSIVLRSFEIKNRDFAILQEILVHADCEGFRILEVPFSYHPRQSGRSNAHIIAFGVSYLRTFLELYRLRNSILSADYDHRAHDSVIPPQRYWQRQRYKHVTELIAGEGPVLDVGCGSSAIIGALPDGSIAMDVLFRKLRYNRIFRAARVQGSGFELPIRSGTFSCVLCSQVIEHVPKAGGFLDELVRVLKPGGALILGTPDYANWQWRFIEAVYERVMPGAYADEHISHYTKAELVERFERIGFTVEDVRYILQGELILKMRKPRA